MTPASGSTTVVDVEDIAEVTQVTVTLEGARTPRNLMPVVGSIDPDFARARYKSPLRYPGAKRGLAPVIKAMVAAYGKPVELFVEPFAGGASTSLEVLAAGAAKRALLADADPMVAAFWRAASEFPENLVDRITDEHKDFVAPGGSIAVERWDYWRGFASSAVPRSDAWQIDMATKCLFLNRTTFSGILHGGAGPIGGRAQASKNTIGCRFNLERIVGLIRQVGALYAQGRIADVWQGDWEVTMKQVISGYKRLVPDSVVAYLDPPYVRKAGRLYSMSFAEPRDTKGENSLDWSTASQHLRLAEYLRRSAQYRWILSYDFHPDLIEQEGLYQARRMTPSADQRLLEGVHTWNLTKGIVHLRYTASANEGRRDARELIVTTLPRSVCRAVDGLDLLD